MSHFIVTRGVIGSVNRIFGTEFSRFSKLEVQALVTANLKRAVDNARMRQITSGHAADMTKLLQTLVAKDALAQERQNRWTRYHLPVLDHSRHKAGHSLHSDELLAIAAFALNQRRAKRS